MQTTKLIQLSIACCLALCALLGASSCEAPPADERAFNKITYYHMSQGLSEVKSPLVELINDAEQRIDIALYRLEDDAVADALIAAKNRGVQLRVVTDMQSIGDSGFVKLLAADVPVVQGDGEVRYLPDPTLTSILQACLEFDGYRECTRRDNGSTQPDDGVIIRPDVYNVMSNNFAVVDDFNIWVSATPLIAGDTIGIGFVSYSQDLGMAFQREFQQMAGGVFATTLDTFNGPVKSTVHGMLYDSRIPDATPGKRLQLQPGYLTNKGIVNIHFNPQQRLVKELIDELYAARSSIFFMTDELLHDFAIDALLYKVQAGFDVRVILREGSKIPRELLDAGVVRTIDAQYLPTMLITNHEEDRNDFLWPRSAMVMSHPLYRATPFEVFTPEPSSGLSNDIVRIYPSDFFTDGTMWVMDEFFSGRNASDPPDNEVQRLTVRWLDTWNRATPSAMP